jgi:hypothetical protein
MLKAATPTGELWKQGQDTTAKPTGTQLPKNEVK